MSKQLIDAADFLGRLALLAIFLTSGLRKIFGFAGTVGYMQSAGITVATPFFLFGAIVFLLAGGLSLLLGFKTRIGAALLIAFLIPTTYFFHPAWSNPGEMISFMKNLGLLGGLLHVLAHGAGGWSLDARLTKGKPA